MQIIKKILFILFCVLYLDLKLGYAYTSFEESLNESLKSYTITYISKNNYIPSKEVYTFYKNGAPISLHMWCARFKKINCYSHNYDVEASIVGYNIINKEESLENPVGFEIQAEDLGNNVNICVAIPTDANHIYFTDDSASEANLADNAFVILEVRQLCY